jgi:hypothetical protein
MRKPIVAGQFYSADKTELDEEIKKSFKHYLGPRMPKVPLKERKIYGCIVPHAGYIYSGACASHAYKELAELNKKSFPDTFIILGPDHSGYGKAFFSLTFDDFETPLGIIKNDTELGAKILQETSHLGLQEDKQAHKYEHSLEVQIPFLQFVAKIVKKEFKIVPIIISTLEYDKLIALGSKLGELCKDKNVYIIASSDFTHYGYNYGFLPFPASEAKTRLKELDRKAINYILKLDSKAFYEEAIKTTICGSGAIVTAIEACKKMGSKKASLLKYYTSAEISKDYSSAVGYASIILI